MIQTAPVPLSYPPEHIEEQYDVIVIGAGPAGASTAALVAEHGHSVLLLERETIPRFHVGESLIPKTYGPLRRLGMLDRLKQSAFPKKYSVQFVTDTGKVTAPFYFDDYDPHESSVTWQVERCVFDRMLVDRAVELGVTFRDQSHVVEVNFEDDHATGVTAKINTGHGRQSEPRRIQSKVVVDASGQSSHLLNRLGLKTKDPHLQKATIWTYWENALRDEGKDEGCTIIMQTEGKKSWFWYIPLSNNIVSVGCTGSLKYMFQSGRGSAEEIYQRELDRCPEMVRRLAEATRVGDYHTTKDFSYRSTKAAGNGWCLVGDAFGFIDPVYSSGVQLALSSGVYAADAIHQAFETNDFSENTLGSWNAEYRRGIENFRRLVYAFYTPGFSFADFLKEHPRYRSNMIDILMGDVFKPNVGEIFDAMGEVVPPPDIEHAAGQQVAMA